MRPEILYKGNSFEGEGGHALGSIRSCPAIRSSTDDHVGVAVINKISSPDAEVGVPMGVDGLVGWRSPA